MVGQGSDGEDDRVSGLFRDKAAKLRIDDRVLNPGAQSKDKKLQFDPMRICIDILCPERRSFADLDTFAVVSVCARIVGRLMIIEEEAGGRKYTTRTKAAMPIGREARRTGL